MASPFSFHCMICFEEFDIDKRYPVVLPCGHTYICNECANRLDKCMECRTPLVEYLPGKMPPGGVAGTAAAGRGATVRGRQTLGGRGSGRGVNNGNTPVEPPKIKKRIPLPKNVVLMSLIEATEVAAENVQNQEHQPSMNQSPMIKTSVLDIEDEEEEKIRASTNLAISDCGTYAVAAKDGLEIFPSRPESLSSNANNESTEEDVDTLVRFFHMEHKLDVDGVDGVSGKGSVIDENNNGSSTTHTARDDVATHREWSASVPNGEFESIEDDKKIDDADEEQRQQQQQPRRGRGGGGSNAPPGRLSWGDRVQIVSMNNGWAKLARGYGFVRAGHQQLVKVGGSVDRSCKLEAMLRQLSTKRKRLREEQKQVDNQFISLMNELQVSLMADEDMTVIAADTFHKNIENDPSAVSASLRSREALFDSTLDLSNHDVKTSNTYDDHTPLKPRFMERPMTPPGDSSKGLFFCSGSDVLNAVLPLSSARTQPPALPSSTRSPAIAHEFNHSQQQNQANNNNNSSPIATAYSQSPTNNVDNTPTRILTSVSHPSPSALRAGARAWREMHGRPASDRVDFRTGMSGHSAIFSSNAHTHSYLAQTRALWAGMSNHTGLSMWKSSSTRRAVSSNYANIQQPTLPAFPSSGSADRNDSGASVG